MVEDNQIKAQISPFAIREGEIKTFDGKDGYVSMNQIVHKINIGHINEIHFAILDLVNEFEFITSRQLYQMLEIKGFDPKSQDKLNNKYDFIYSICGISPNDIPQSEEELWKDIAKITEIVKENKSKKLVAIVLQKKEKEYIEFIA